MAGREEARATRAKSRASRRKEPGEPAESPERADDDTTSSEGESLNAVKQAAKVAAVGAAVGAATAAARAFSSQDREDEEVSEPVEAQSGQAEESSAPGDSHQSEQEDGESPSGTVESAPSTSNDQARDGEGPTASAERKQEPIAGADPGDVADAARKAREQLGALLEREPESVSALERTRDGWLVTLEVLELSRIPESTDVLASYEVDLDSDLGLRRYARVGRYTRSQANGGDRG